MGRPKDSLNVSDRERARIRQLYVTGVRVADIAKRIKRGESVVYRTVRGLKRPRPRPSSRVADRDAQVLQMRREGRSYSQIGQEFDITASHACEIVRRHLGKRRPRPVKRTAVSKMPPRKPLRPPALTKEQSVRRDATIQKLWLRGIGVTRLALRFGISLWKVRRILTARGCRPAKR